VRSSAEADDLTQDALVRALRSHDRYAPGTNMKAWTFTILRNQFISDRRRSWRSQPLDPEVAERTLRSNDDPSRRLEVADVRRAMLALPLPQREALTLIGAAGMSYEEAAEICQVAVGTVKSRVSRARLALQAILATGDMAEEVSPEEAVVAIFQDVQSIRNGSLVATASNIDQ
jgi:RNA polymerase sigma-70 factor (ECF subfamily)